MTPILTAEPQPDTHWPYWSRRLVCWWLIDAPGWQPAVLVVGDGPLSPTQTPAWRLTAATFAWFWAAVANLCDRPAVSQQQALAALESLAEMDRWLTTHGMGDAAATAVRRARAGQVVPLTDPPAVTDLTPPTKVDASFMARRRGAA